MPLSWQLFLFHLGCTSDNHAMWWVGDVVPDPHDCHAIKGSRAVLDLQEFSGSLIIPFAWGGSIKVLERRGEDVLLRLDLEGYRGHWSHRGKQWFERQGAPVE